jgi:hypothetical protein
VIDEHEFITLFHRGAEKRRKVSTQKESRVLKVRGQFNITLGTVSITLTYKL